MTNAHLNIVASQYENLFTNAGLSVPEGGYVAATFHDFWKDAMQTFDNVERRVGAEELRVHQKAEAFDMDWMPMIEREVKVANPDPENGRALMDALRVSRWRADKAMQLELTLNVWERQAKAQGLEIEEVYYNEMRDRLRGEVWDEGKNSEEVMARVNSVPGMLEKARAARAPVGADVRLPPLP